MAALTKGQNYPRRGAPHSAREFGYPVAAGEKVFRGSFIALNSSGNIVRVQTSGAAVFIGIADRDLDNSASAAVSTDKVVGLKGVYGIAVPAASFSNIGATVYASDDGTLTLTQSGSLLTAGTISGIEAGLTYVTLAGS